MVGTGSSVSGVSCKRYWYLVLLNLFTFHAKLQNCNNLLFLRHLRFKMQSRKEIVRPSADRTFFNSQCYPNDTGLKSIVVSEGHYIASLLLCSHSL